MSSPRIVHGRFHCGTDCTVGENVVVDVDEEVVFGDRCVIPDNTYFSGRRVTVGNDFYGYSWEWKRLDVGRGRRGEDDAVLTVGSRCTFHDNRIDLARRVEIGDDVGLSPEVVVYTHYYWQSPLDGFPLGYFPVSVGDRTIVGFRSTLLPGAEIGPDCCVATGSVVTRGDYLGGYVYGGTPARRIAEVVPLGEHFATNKFHWILDRYPARGLLTRRFPTVTCDGMTFDLVARTCHGDESDRTDDFRWHLFRHGLRFYTKRPFKKMER